MDRRYGRKGSIRIMNGKINVDIIASGYFKSACGFEHEVLMVPQQCQEAFIYVLTWLNENFAVDPSTVYLMLNDKSTKDKSFLEQTIKPGDTFRILPLMSGG